MNEIHMKEFFMRKRSNDEGDVDLNFNNRGASIHPLPQHCSPSNKRHDL